MGERVRQRACEACVRRARQGAALTGVAREDAEDSWHLWQGSRRARGEAARARRAPTRPLRVRPRRRVVPYARARPASRSCAWGDGPGGSPWNARRATRKAPRHSRKGSSALRAAGAAWRRVARRAPRTCGCQLGEDASASGSGCAARPADARASSSSTIVQSRAAHVSAARFPLCPSSTAHTKSAHGTPETTMYLSSFLRLGRCATPYVAHSPMAPLNGGGGPLMRAHAPQLQRTPAPGSRSKQRGTRQDAGLCARASKRRRRLEARLRSGDLQAGGGRAV
jgi:hypothetical protein